MMECLRALKDEFQAATIDKEIVADLMAIIYLTRIWSSPDGMLGGNGILTQEQTNCLLTWIEIYGRLSDVFAK